jgi:hypothetical protein
VGAIGKEVVIAGRTFTVIGVEGDVLEAGVEDGGVEEDEGHVAGSWYRVGMGGGEGWIFGKTLGFAMFLTVDGTVETVGFYGGDGAPYGGIFTVTVTGIETPTLR